MQGGAILHLKNRVANFLSFFFPLYHDATVVYDALVKTALYWMAPNSDIRF